MITKTLPHYVFLISIFLFCSCNSHEEIVKFETKTSSTLEEHSFKVKETSSILRSVSNFESIDVEPTFGRPYSTSYHFRVVSRYKSTTEKVWLKLYNKATHEISYYLMNNQDGIHYDLRVQLKENGWYDYQYMVGESNNRQVISSGPTKSLCNTYNEFNPNGFSHLTWPFGADGSSWSNRVGANGQLWRGGQERKDENQNLSPSIRGCGYDECKHTGRTERFSDDWNRGTGRQDLGAEVRSPLDGYIESVSTYSVGSLGNSKYVSIIQKAADGSIYRFYVSHLETQSVKPNQYVQAGITKIGTVGKSGAESPHAHCNLRKNGRNGDSIKFRFDADY